MYGLCSISRRRGTSTRPRKDPVVALKSADGDISSLDGPLCAPWEVQTVNMNMMKGWRDEGMKGWKGSKGSPHGLKQKVDHSPLPSLATSRRETRLFETLPVRCIGIAHCRIVALFIPHSAFRIVHYALRIAHAFSPRSFSYLYLYFYSRIMSTFISLINRQQHNVPHLKLGTGAGNWTFPLAWRWNATGTFSSKKDPEWNASNLLPAFCLSQKPPDSLWM